MCFFLCFVTAAPAIGDGCGPSNTRCFFRLICAPFFCANLPHSMKTTFSVFSFTVAMIASVYSSQPCALWLLGRCASTVNTAFKRRTPFVQEKESRFFLVYNFYIYLPCSAQCVKSPDVGWKCGYERRTTEKTFFNDGGTLIPGATEKHKPLAWLLSW